MDIKILFLELNFIFEFNKILSHQTLCIHRFIFLFIIIESFDDKTFLKCDAQFH